MSNFQGAACASCGVFYTDRRVIFGFVNAGNAKGKGTVPDLYLCSRCVGLGVTGPHGKFKGLRRIFTDGTLKRTTNRNVKQQKVEMGVSGGTSTIRCHVCKGLFTLDYGCVMTLPNKKRVVLCSVCAENKSQRMMNPGARGGS